MPAPRAVLKNPCRHPLKEEPPIVNKKEETKGKRALILKRVPKRIAEALTKRYFLELVRQSYRNPASAERHRIMAEGRKWYGVEPSTSPFLARPRWFMDFVFEAQRELHRSKTLPPLDLGATSIGVGPLKMHCSSGDINSSVVYLLGFTDEMVFLDLYRCFASEGTLAVDVGANLGIHTLLLSCCVGDEGRVIAFEPLPLLYERLCANVELNGLTNVVTRRKGVGNERTAAYMNMDPEDFNIGRAHVSAQGDHPITLTTLDHELKDVTSPVSLVKIDTEGYELHVIKGSRRILDGHRPVLVCEFNPGSYSFHEVRASIPHDYLYFRMPGNYRGRLEPVSDELNAACDLVIVPREKWSTTIGDKLGHLFAQ